MKLQVQSYNNGGTAYNSESEETALLSYSIDHEFNKPAIARIVLADPTGSIAQKYNVDANDVYIGVGKATIEDPDGTDVFYGRIVKAEPDPSNYRVVLTAKDWLDQLDDEAVDYDMREDLGSGLRQSEITSDIDGDETKSAAPAYTTGTRYYIYDDNIDLDADEFKGDSILLPVTHVGDQTITIGPYKYDGTYDTPTGDISDLWLENETGMYFAKNGANLLANFHFRLYGNEGSLGAAVTALSVKVIIQMYDAKSDGTIHIWDGDGNFYKEILSDGVANLADDTEPYRTYTVEISEFSRTNAQADDDGLIKVRIEGISGAGAVFPKFNIELITITATVPVATGHSSLIDINGVYGVPAAFSKCFRYEDGVGYTDETTNMNDDDGAGDVQLLPNPISQNDAFYFGFVDKCNGFDITISQAGVYDGTMIWEYYDGDSWETLPSVIDDTDKFETAGTAIAVTWPMPSDWDSNIVNAFDRYWIRLRMSSAVPNITVTPLATQGWALTGAGNKFMVDTDCSITGLGLWEGIDYCVVGTIGDRINEIVLAGDPQVTLTTSVGTTSNVSSDTFKQMSRLAILQELAKTAGAVFWLPLAATEVKWRKVTDSVSTAVTDASVSKWIVSGYDMYAMKNKYTVYGVKAGDTQIIQTYSDATSIAKYLTTRNEIITTRAFTDYDALATATTLVTRDKDITFDLAFEVSGLTAYRLGDYLEITSSLLNISAVDYTVVGWSYDSATYTSTIKLEKSKTTGYSPSPKSLAYAITAYTDAEKKRRSQLIAPYPDTED